ncbi:hypothetical protein [Vampirovibrio chlorellavorus]|uniref:hypothetical protein n=1 Tax=Vampirovibrio chlorellavorus TaxID=758823 RepID=UPI0026EDDDC1|nr:hypothetical protein [Vampirovibrio chlorellavorus]
MVPSLAPQVDLSAAQLDRNAGIAKAIGSVLQMLSVILADISGTKGYPAPAPAPQPILPAAQSATTSAAPQSISASPDARLNSTLSAIANDPEGARLLAAAQANGYTIEVGDPSAAIGGSFDKGNISCPGCQAALDAGQQINGVTLPSQKKIIINPNAPDFEKTVVHELVHAATPGDGNSQTEEGIADVIGYRVANRITGKAVPGDARSIFLNKIANYPGLTGANGIRNTLANLGLNAGI